MQQKFTISQSVELFLLDAQSRRFTDHTLRFYQERFRIIMLWCADHGVTNIGDLTSTHIRQFLAYQQSRNLSSSYVHSFARALRTLLNFCVRDGIIEISPFAKVKMPRLEAKILPALSTDEIRAILAKCDSHRDECVVLFMLDSGVRASELIELNAGDVDFKTGSVTVHQGKGQKDRITYIGFKTRKRLRAYLILRGDPTGKEALFVSEKGGARMTYSGLAQMFKRLRKASGVDECHAHAMRRTFAISCLRGGMDLYVLAKLMGHSDISVLKFYLDLVKDDLKAAHDNASPVDKII